MTFLKNTHKLVPTVTLTTEPYLHNRQRIHEVIFRQIFTECPDFTQAACHIKCPVAEILSNLLNLEAAAGVVK